MRRTHKSLCRAIAQWSFCTASAFDGEEGLKMWHEQAPEIVVLDLNGLCRSAA